MMCLVSLLCPAVRQNSATQSTPGQLIEGSRAVAEQLEAHYICTTCPTRVLLTADGHREPSMEGA